MREILNWLRSWLGPGDEPNEEPEATLAPVGDGVFIEVKIDRLLSGDWCRDLDDVSLMTFQWAVWAEGNDEFKHLRRGVS